VSSLQKLLHAPFGKATPIILVFGSVSQKVTYDMLGRAWTRATEVGGGYPVEWEELRALAREHEMGLIHKLGVIDRLVFDPKHPATSSVEAIAAGTHSLQKIASPICSRQSISSGSYGEIEPKGASKPCLYDVL
jgi:hypothetical protein